MGVMECFRKGCDNILCSRYSSQYGYICHYCFEELVESGIETNIAEFMRTPKKENLQKWSRKRMEEIFIYNE